jgi:uncharacterized protein YndB with AHSA1/START domain
MTDPSGPDDAVVIERTFDAPVSLIWEMWTVAEHFASWYGPEGATIPVAEMDVRVGGSRRICMQVRTPRGPMEMWFSGEYLEVVEQQRLVYTESVSDEAGNPVGPADGDQPGVHPVTQVRVELEAIDAGTRMVLTHVGLPADSPGATGWNMALDELSALVASRAGT